MSSSDAALPESRIRVPSGEEHVVVCVGVSLVVFYAKPMRELAEAVRNLMDLYRGFVPGNAIQFSLGASGGWRPYTARKLASDLRKLSAEGLDYWSIHCSSGPAGSVGDYGFHFFGSNFLEREINPRETCACFMEFPREAVEGVDRQRFEEFAVSVGDVEPFESGYAGYSFKHLMETWRDEALSWISKRARRFLAVDLSYDTFRTEARGRVVNVSWLTLLGTELVERLGGLEKIRPRLSKRVAIRPLRHGLLLVAGDEPAVGDVNRGAADVGALKEVAALTKGVRVPDSAIMFGDGEFRRTWLSRLD